MIQQLLVFPVRPLHDDNGDPSISTPADRLLNIAAPKGISQALHLQAEPDASTL